MYISFEMPFKVYVDVEAHFDKDGTLLPWEITWEDGRKYAIDRVTNIQRGMPKQTDYMSDCYTIVIQGRESRLYFERNRRMSGNSVGRWFVERRTSTA